MNRPLPSANHAPLPPLPTLFLRLLVLLLPLVLLLCAGLRAEDDLQQVYLLGTAVQGVVCTLTVLAPSFWRQPFCAAIPIVYGLSLAWLMLGGLESSDWFLHLARAALIVVPLGFFAAQSLLDIDAPALRRARIMAQRIADRKEWPADLEACKTLPEVKAFREALHVDAAPALPLLRHPRPQVQMAALGALEFRKHWRPGQAEAVLQVALRATEPEVRAAAIGALANIEDRTLIESLGEFLRDPAPQVRHGATQALLWDSERRWHWLRHAVRRALGDPLCQQDGPLRHDGQPFPPEAVEDLLAWAAEKGLTGYRAAVTLARHYAQVLSESPDPETLEILREQVMEPKTPPVLRVELARLLIAQRELDSKLLGKLIDPANPAPLRLMAIEALLDAGDAPEAVVALRDLAKLPNREIALATADVVHRRLHVDLGLPSDGLLPPLQSREATEITRRLRRWATLGEAEDESIPPFARVDERVWHALSE